MIENIVDDMNAELAKLEFPEPVAYVYNPLEYARTPASAYFEKYGQGQKDVILVGMNPGPFGMGQTGVPFGSVPHVRDFLGISTEVGHPPVEHPKRVIEGFACKRVEGSGKRLWEWVEARFGTASRWSERFFVWNYCPLLFLHEGGRNITPATLRKAQRESIHGPCDAALMKLIGLMEPSAVVGIGAYAADRIRALLSDTELTCGQILHPSPANPIANTRWIPVVEEQFEAMGVALPEQTAEKTALKSA